MRKKPAKRAHPYGPAMTALRPMQQRFVEAWIENPGFRPTQLLRLAGHRGTDWACARSSYNWARDPKVLEAVREASAVRLASIVPKALAALEVMIDDPKSRFHQKAVEGVLNRTGFHEIKETKQTVEHTVNTGELIAQIKSRLERLGLALPAPTVQDGDVVETLS